MPVISAAATRPERNGSSETYSKFLPHKGDRLMLMPGPRRTETCSALASSPRASPTWRMRSRFHDEPNPTAGGKHVRSEEHTSELQSLMRISYAVFCLKKKKRH